MNQEKSKRLKEQIKNEEIVKGLFHTEATYRQKTSGMTLRRSKETRISDSESHKESREKQERRKM